MDYVPFSQDDFDAAPQQQRRHRARSSARGGNMLQIILFTIACVLAFGFAYWFGTTYPDKMKDIIIMVDRLGVTEAGSIEQNRIRAINKLDVLYEEKQALINHTVFMRASTEMVSLALGDPFCVIVAPATKDNPETVHWIYFIEGDSRPTRLAFQSDQLIGAAKDSALRACSQRGSKK